MSTYIINKFTHHFQIEDSVIFDEKELSNCEVFRNEKQFIERLCVVQNLEEDEIAENIYFKTENGFIFESSFQGGYDMLNEDMSFEDYISNFKL